MIDVQKPGLLVSVQAAPRQGVARFGLPAGGPMDPDATHILNALLGNPRFAPVLETAGGHLQLRSDRETVVAALGDGYVLTIDQRDAELGRLHRLAAGTVLSLRATRPRGWGYLGFAGGIALPEILGSVSTDVRNGIGGWQGRVLAAGDRLPLEGATPPLASPLGTESGWGVAWPKREPDASLWSVVVHEAAFAENLLQGEWTITTSSTRQALVLSRHSLRPHDERERISMPQLAGAIQSLPDGRFALLGPEAQTVGGYPIAAVLVCAQLPRMSRVSPGQTLRFQAITREQAIAMQSARARELALWLAEIRRYRLTHGWS